VSIVRRDYRGRGAGRAVLAALIEAAAARGMHKLTSRVFPENVASRELLKGLGFEEIGIHRRHGQSDDRWRDCVIVELLLSRIVPGNPARWGVRCQTSRRRKTDAAAAVMHARPHVPKGSSARVSPIRSAIVARQRFFGIFWPLFLAGFERLRDNRRMTDAGS
jgi:hypothetical protein